MRNENHKKHHFKLFARSRLVASVCSLPTDHTQEVRPDFDSACKLRDRQTWTCETLQLEHLNNIIRTCSVTASTISGLLKWICYLSLKKKVSPLICAIASKTTGSLQMSIGVTGPRVGDGPFVDAPVFKNVQEYFISEGRITTPTFTNKNTFFVLCVHGTCDTWYWVSP